MRDLQLLKKDAEISNLVEEVAASVKEMESTHLKVGSHPNILPHHHGCSCSATCGVVQASNDEETVRSAKAQMKIELQNMRGSLKSAKELVRCA